MLVPVVEVDGAKVVDVLNGDSSSACWKHSDSDSLRCTVGGKRIVCRAVGESEGKSNFLCNCN